MMTGGKRINGKFFSETHSSGVVRYTHRYFIDGKLVSRAKFAEEIKAAKAAEAAEVKEITERHNRDGGPALLRNMFKMGG